MTFYNHIEDARYEMFRLVNGWTREGAETKARISESLDSARIEYMQKESENAKLRELCKDIWNDAIHFEGFWDYVHDDGTIYREDELPHYQERMRECGIEVK